MIARERLPNRREATTFDIEAGGQSYHATVGWFADGRLAEVFVTTRKAGSMAGIMASDAAVLCSIALQYGAPAEVLRRALMRDAQGRAIGPLGVVLDLVQPEGHAVDPPGEVPSA
jgi:hypothetical protein